MAEQNPSQFPEGAKLGYPIYDERGVLLLQAGTLLTQCQVSALQRRQVQLRLAGSLEIVKGRDVGAQIPIKKAVTRIGRSEECKICADSRFVSSCHCIIHKAPLSFHIQDMGSTNGTYVNGRRIRETTELRTGDVIQFGDMAVRLHCRAILEGSGEETKEITSLILGSEGRTADVSTEEPKVNVGWVRRERPGYRNGCRGRDAASDRQDLSIGKSPR